MLEVVTLCNKRATYAQNTKNQLQKLTGKLIYIHRCVKPAPIGNRLVQTEILLPNFQI